jgi:replication factor A1
MYGAPPGAGPVARVPSAQDALQGARVVPIRSLNPYAGRWAIKGRCTVKGEVRTWSNARGEGKLLSFDLLDREGGEIRVTAWSDMVERVDALVQPGKVYVVTRASLKPRNARFNPTPHEFEVYLERNSEVVPVEEEDEETRAIPAMQYNVSGVVGS